MKCVVCRQGGETRPGKATAVLQRGGATVVINDVPALAGARGQGTAAACTCSSTSSLTCADNTRPLERDTRP